MDYTNTKEPKKVIDGLKICSDTSRSCCDDNCPYYKSYTSCQKTEILQDALILLKEQEALTIRCGDCKWYDTQMEKCDLYHIDAIDTHFYCASGTKQESPNKQAVKLELDDEQCAPICKIIFDVPYYFCGDCKAMLNMYATKAEYCSACGKRVAWKGDRKEKG